MVLDVRRINLSGEELTAALIAYQRLTPEFLPGGKIVSCKPLHDTNIQVTLEAPANQSPRLSDIMLKGTDILKPLIRFCLEHNIMMPRNGQKTISIADNKVGLYIVLNLDIDLSEVLGQPGAHVTKVTPADLPPKTVQTLARSTT